MAEKPGLEAIRSMKIDQRDESSGFRTRCGFRNAFTGQQKSLYDISFPYDIDILAGDAYIPAGVSAYNRLWVEIAPNLDLDLLVSGAALGAAIAATDTEVTVNAQAKAALDAMLSVNGDIQTQEVFARFTSVPADETDFTDLRKFTWDSANSKLKVSDGSQINLTAANGAKIFVTVRYEDGSYLAPGQELEIGRETFGSSSIAANTKIRFIIENVDAGNLDIGFNITYLHD